MSYRVALLIATGLAVSLLNSCETTELPPPPEPRGRPIPREVATPGVQWELDPSPQGYKVSVVVDRDVFFIGDGGEYMSARRLPGGSRRVPAGAVSGFEVSLPDGELDVYWVEEGRPGTLLVFKKSYDAEMDRWSPERRMRTITY